MPRTVEIENDAGALDKIKMGATVTSWAWRVVQEIFDDAKEEKDGQPGTPSDEMHDGDLDDASSRDVRSILSRRCFADLLRHCLCTCPQKRRRLITASRWMQVTSKTWLTRTPKFCKQRPLSSSRVRPMSPTSVNALFSALRSA